MGRLRVGGFADEKENAQRVSSRPWDNSQPDEEDSSGFASLRVEHFVDVNIASRAAMFQGVSQDSCPMTVADLADRFEGRASSRENTKFIYNNSRPQSNSNSSRDASSATDEEIPVTPMIEPSIKTQLGRRSVKPPLMSAKPTPFAMLPIPSSSKSPSGLSEDAYSPILVDRTQFLSPSREGSAVPSASQMKTPTAESPAPIFRSRASRCSVRASPARNSISRSSARGSVRHSVRMSVSSQIPQNFASPRDSSFLADDDDHVRSESQSLGYSDNDTLDTFGSIGSEHEEEAEDEKQSLSELQTPDRAEGALPSLSHSGSEKAIFPEIKFDLGLESLGRDEDEGDVLDVPRDLMTGAGGGKALRELQCASVTAGNELAEQVRQYAARSEVQTETDSATSEGGRTKDKISRAQGELELRSRIFRRWNTRYASIVDHAYFGAVLFLYRHDAKASRQGTIALKNSKMIVLADSTVRELEPLRKSGPPSLFELRTAQRRYVFACIDDNSRAFWLEQLSSFAS